MLRGHHHVYCVFCFLILFRLLLHSPILRLCVRVFFLLLLLLFIIIASIYTIFFVSPKHATLVLYVMLDFSSDWSQDDLTELFGAFLWPISL